MNSENLQINSKGQLTIQNYVVVGNQGNIKIPSNINIKFLSNGTIKKIEKKNFW